MTKSKFIRTLVLTTILLTGVNNAFSQFAFTNSNNLLSSTSLFSLRSGCAISVVDVNSDGLDDILRMDQATHLHLELQERNGTFTHTDLGVVLNSGAWAMAAADVDHNGWVDIATGNYGECVIVKLFSSGGVVTSTISTLTGSYFVQNITFGDINNDGWIDLFVCDDNDVSKIYKNDGTGNLDLDNTLITLAINPSVFYDSDPADSGNYGSVWTDFDGDGDMDLFVAHCRQSATSSTDLRRKDRLYVNDGNNNYTESSSAYGIEVTDFKQTWTASFGDIDNDGDFDLLQTCHGEASIILENNGTGMFTDITTTTGFNCYFDPIESVFEDFDNDGYLDILVTGNEWELWHNNGNKTFTQVSGVFADNDGMVSFATGDLNHDGAIDLYASYGDPYNSPSISYDDVLYLNNKSNSNHFITFNLTGVVSNVGAIGAKATIYGDFGVQVREIRSGESYGTSNSFQLHFGLGTNTTIDSARIDWPAGGVTLFNTLNADQFVTVIENGCTLTNNTLTGPFIICGNQTVTLNAVTGFTSYDWSSSETTPSITASVTGNYNVLVTSSNGCTNISPSAIVQINPDQTPTVSVSGNLVSCYPNVVLTSTIANSYTWTGPNNYTSSAQSIAPTIAGDYSVSIQGQCASFTSLPITVNILSYPEPTVTNVSGPGPAIFNLSAVGTGMVNWYDSLSGGTQLASGNSFTTSIIASDTTFYVENEVIVAGESGDVGPKYFNGTSTFSPNTIEGNVEFNVFDNCILKSVKVYTDMPGIREIQLKDYYTGIVTDSLIINLPADTSVIILNWPLYSYYYYQLTTDALVNSTSLGFVAPRLMRNNLGVTYPYNLNGLISITGSNQGVNNYYYFYDWKVEKMPTICTSGRVPITVTITSTADINSLTLNNGYQIFPNPTTATANIVFNRNFNSKVFVKINDLTGKIIKTWSVENPVQDQNYNLDISGVPAGIYFISLENDTQNSIQKLVITN